MTRGRWLSKRWWTLVIDVRGRVIHNRAFWTKRAAVRYGGEVSCPPLNTFEVRRG